MDPRTNPNFQIMCFDSCGKDNRTILWDLYTLRPIADIPNDDDHHAHDHTTAGGSHSSASDLYGGGGVRSSQQRRYDVQWSPLKRGVVSTCSLDRKVQTHSVMGLATKCGRPPKWLAKSGSGVSCGFGGSLVSFSSTNKTVQIATVVEQPTLVQASAIFEAEIASMNVVDYCRARAAATKDAYESQMWGFMQVLFGKCREVMGFSPVGGSDSSSVIITIITILISILLPIYRSQWTRRTGRTFRIPQG
jgi:protein transport protein SEC31